MALFPDVSVNQVISAMDRFDAEFSSDPEWLDWSSKESFKYAIFHNFNIYPVKQIVSMATGVSKDSFSGGDQANNFIKAKGFKVVELRNPTSWVIRSGSVAIKYLDKSAFTQGTGIPIEIRSFFIDGEINKGEHRPVTLVFQDIEYSSPYITVESSPTARNRLFWPGEFIKLLAKQFPVYYEKCKSGDDIKNAPRIAMTFERVEGFTRYAISFDIASEGEIRTDKDHGEGKDGEWSDPELEEAVKGYLWMLEQEKNRKPYSKAELNRSLREGVLYNRTKASIEYRMQNISAALQEICQPWIKGYLPAKNIGTGVKDRILKALATLNAYTPEDYAPTVDSEVLEQKVRKLRKRVSVVGIPRGELTPQQTTVTTTSYARNPLVKAWVLENAKGICEGCGCPAPFSTLHNEPFLEVHHMKQLADGGSDTISNAVALCPNCHRRCHLSVDKEEYTSFIFRNGIRFSASNK
jgi:5-methylcytosine-specific restriction protein A